MSQKVVIIGSGFSSLSASCYLAKLGYDVAIYEKNDTVGGRARQLKKEGFTFDIGPTWYWMPDVFEKFFSDFNKHPSDYYHLNKLDPAYQVYFGKDDSKLVSGNIEEIHSMFEAEEKGSSLHLREFLTSAKNNYNTAIKDLVYKPGESISELITPVTIKRAGQFFSTIRKTIRKKIKNEKLIKILEFPVLFLGAKPSNTPSFYNFMNYADFGLGTWHPNGGMFTVVTGMVTLAQSLGVEFITEANVEQIKVSKNNKVEGLIVNGEFKKSDSILSGADYHHTETLLPKENRQYSEKYWSNKTFAPSALLFYVGLSKPVKNVSHHTLFFDCDFEVHAESIYDTPKWPEDPLFYVSFPSKTDASAAPEGKEAATFLIPLAPGIKDTNEIREAYFKKIITRLEKVTNQTIKENIIFKESFCVNDFKEQYNSYQGNAYGLANTLMQTAFLRPKIRSKKVKNLFFTGQLTVPGPGVPPALISGKIAADLILKNS